MAERTFGSELDSYVSFALAMMPEVSVAGEKSGDAIKVRFAKGGKLSARELSSIETLVDKYEKVRKFLPSGTSLDALQVHETKPRVTFEPNTKYEIVSIPAEQLALAKDVAGRVERIHGAHQSGRHDEARKGYEELQTFLREKRASFMGDFVNVPEIDAVVGGHGVGQNGNPQVAGGGAIIFVIIEIYVS